MTLPLGVEAFDPLMSCVDSGAGNFSDTDARETAEGGFVIEIVTGLNGVLGAASFVCSGIGTD